MAYRGITALGALVCLTLVFSARVESQQQQHAGEAPPGMPDAAQMAEMMEMMKTVGEPGPHHQHLNEFVGEWKTTMRMWIAGPNGPATESHGESNVKSIFGGRFIMEEHRADVMMPDETGQIKKHQFHGIGLTGYDNVKNLYTSVWIDSMSTQMITSTGARHPETGLYSFYGTMDEPMLGVHDRMVKYEHKFMGPDKHLMTVYDLHLSDDYKTFEILYERK